MLLRELFINEAEGLDHEAEETARDYIKNAIYDAGFDLNVQHGLDDEQVTKHLSRILKELADELMGKHSFEDL